MKRYRTSALIISAIIIISIFSESCIMSFGSVPSGHTAALPAVSEIPSSAYSASGNISAEISEFKTPLSARSAILMEPETGTVLFEKNSHEKLPPASVTKVMTMLVISEALENGKISLKDKVTVSSRAASMGGSQMYMEPMETHTMDELLTGIAMVSANDACVAAAEHVCGSVEIFVEQMNTMAEKLGLKDTHFVNTNGLPVSDHYTSAYDIAVMSSQLIKHDSILPYLSKKSCTLNVGKPGSRQTSLEMFNTNRLLRTFDGATGIKTGFTQDAGYCLSASAHRNGLTLISVILGCEKSETRFSEAAQLLDYGFANLEAVKIAGKNEIAGKAPVENGIPYKVGIAAAEDITVIVPKGKSSEITWKIKYREDLSAPLKKGDNAGKLIIMQNKKEFAHCDLAAVSNVKKAGIKTRVKRRVRKIFHRIS